MRASVSDPRLAAAADGAVATAVATYTRRSTDEEHQRFSIEMQDDRLGKYVSSQDSWHLATTYSDDKSGATLDRPGLQRLLRDARAGRFSMLLVYRVDCLSRSARARPYPQLSRRFEHEDLAGERGFELPDLLR
jgi:DNA invertase Pin-like site-specific DNA recombinase